ncbi:hypothetical protein N5C67_00115 [Comamonas thiooxydans]|uniref:hypothetical protein n=1 Tax=Comamonas thiooxydans TaxID=363952 RepID=UPI00244A3909|nr:hypothetical protein [Comamonas thiooxydans]MDH1251046.1 hypothetical protein [Comamonas thiooxydans]
MGTDYIPQPGDLYARLESGEVVFVPPERQLTCWRGPNPYEKQRQQPIGNAEALRKILQKKASRK